MNHKAILSFLVAVLVAVTIYLCCRVNALEKRRQEKLVQVWRVEGRFPPVLEWQTGQDEDLHLVFVEERK